MVCFDLSKFGQSIFYWYMYLVNNLVLVVKNMADAPNIVRVKIHPEQLKRYKKAGYRVIGNYLHSGVEICRWTKAALKRQAPLNKRTKMLKMELSRDSLEQIFVLHCKQPHALCHDVSAERRLQSGWKTTSFTTTTTIKTQLHLSHFFCFSFKNTHNNKNKLANKTWT